LPSFKTITSSLLPDEEPLDPDDEEEDEED
jgi:hypothetical protein